MRTRKLDTRKVVLSILGASLLIAGVQGALAGCSPVNVSIVNHSALSYLVSGVGKDSGITIHERSYAQGQIESARYYGHQCGLIQLSRVDHPQDVKYALVNPDTEQVSVVIHPNSTLETAGLTEQGFQLKDYQEWYGVKKYIT